MSLAAIAKIKRLQKLKAENQKANRNQVKLDISFIDSVKQFGRSDRGEEIVIENWHHEYSQLISDLEITETLTTGCAQNSKAQPLTAKVLTPDGWVLMGDLSIGDKVCTPMGETANVIGVYPQGKKEVFKVTMSDGATTECCDEHLWLTQTAGDRRIKVREHLKDITTLQRDWLPLENGTRPGSVKNLSEIKDTIHVTKSDGKTKISRRDKPVNNHTIPIVKSTTLVKTHLPIDPYVLGYILGNGCISQGVIMISSDDKDVIDKIRYLLPSTLQCRKKPNNDYDYSIVKANDNKTTVNEYLNSLRSLKLQGKKSDAKFIPEIYLSANDADRLDLLRGLMDSDGTVDQAGNIYFGSSSEQLTKNIQQLIWSLGGITRKIKVRENYYTYKGVKKQGLDSYSISIRMSENRNPFWLPRKRYRVSKKNTRLFNRYIENIEPSGFKECQCILIDSYDHLYITDDYIVTHNTLMHNFLLIYLVVERQYNALWVYSQERVMQRMVAIQFKPMIDYYLNLSDRANTGNTKAKSTTLYQYDKANAIFSYSSTSRSVEGKKTAAAGSAIVSFSADIAFLEERSQWQPGSDAPVYRRLDASRIPSKPVRQLGTNGAYGAGIHEAMEDCSHEFNPHCICEHCDEEIHLHPFGTLLQPEERIKANGEKIISYLGSSGKPRKWFHHDIDNAVESAYFGCPHCGGEISDDNRITKSYFRCIRTGIRLTDFLALEKDTSKRLKAGINLLPLLKRSQYSLATYIIQQGLSTTNAADWAEQQLGIPSQSETVKITIEMIKNALKAPLPEYRPPTDRAFDLGNYHKVTLAGIDCGRSSHWIWICTYYTVHDRFAMGNNEISDKSYRVLEYCGDIVKTDIPAILEEFKVSYAIIDNEPDIESSARLCEATCLEMADQKSGQFEEFKEATAKDGGIEYPIWKIRNEKFLRQVLNLFSVELPDGYPLLRFRDPESWVKWFSVKSERSPIKHLTSVTYDPEIRKFIRPDDHIDDIYYAAAFCEAAFFIYLENGGSVTMWD